DELARNCFSSDAELVEMEAPISYVKRCLNETALLEWNRHWTSTRHGRWTATFFPTVAHRRKAGRMHLSFISTQYITGHGKVNSYLFARKRRNSPDCLCGALQDCRHLLLECPLLQDARRVLEMEAARKGLNLIPASLHKMIADPNVRTWLFQAFEAIHATLVE